VQLSAQMLERLSPLAAGQRVFLERLTVPARIAGEIQLRLRPLGDGKRELDAKDREALRLIFSDALSKSGYDLYHG
jgi:hypothetical protein